MKLLRRFRYGLMSLSVPASRRLQREWETVESPVRPETLGQRPAASGSVSLRGQLRRASCR